MNRSSHFCRENVLYPCSSRNPGIISFLAVFLLTFFLFPFTAPSWAGPVLLSGQTPDVNTNYCCTADPYNQNIKGTYAKLFDNLYGQVTNGQTKVLAIGNMTDMFIYDLVHDLIPITVDRVAGSAALAAVNFSAYAAIYIPSSNAYNFYGLTSGESATLTSRAADIAAFVNSGGGLFSLAQSPYDADPYGFLSGLGGGLVHYDNGTNMGGYSAITPTAAGVDLGSAAGFDLNNLNNPGAICPVPFPCGNLWGYDVYTAYPSFLQSLATANAPTQNWYDGIAALLYGNTGVFEETSPAIAYTGTWSHYTCATCSGGGLNYSGQTGARADFSFTGTGIKWIVAKGPMMGKARVYLDGVNMGLVDLYNPTTKLKVVLQKTGLTPSLHNLAIEVSGQKNPGATGSNVTLDALEVIP